RAAWSDKPKAATPGSRLSDSPGWYYVVDPESTSVLLGRRTNAPLVNRPFQGGTRSMDELGRRVCSMLHHSARESLWTLCVQDSEFRNIMWREFPESRPATGLRWLDAWISLYQRLVSGISGAISDYGGEDWQFVRITSDSVATYKNFK